MPTCSGGRHSGPDGATEETSLDEGASLDKMLGIKVVYQPEHEDNIDFTLSKY